MPTAPERPLVDPSTCHQQAGAPVPGKAPSPVAPRAGGSHGAISSGYASSAKQEDERAAQCEDLSCTVAQAAPAAPLLSAAARPCTRAAERAGEKGFEKRRRSRRGNARIFKAWRCRRAAMERIIEARKRARGGFLGPLRTGQDRYVEPENRWGPGPQAAQRPRYLSSTVEEAHVACAQHADPQKNPPPPRRR